MQLSLGCSNCGQVVFGAAIVKTDVAQWDASCHKCGAIYRVSVNCIHDGKQSKPEDTKQPLGYCAQCEPKVPFFTSEEMKDHDIKIHGRQWKG